MVLIWTCSFSHFWTVFTIAVCYCYSFLGLELGSLFSPPLAEDLLAPAFFFPSFKEIHYFFRHCRHMARQRVCVTRRFDFSTAFTVDLMKHLWDQDWDLVLDEISNSQLFSSAYIFNSQNWISTCILRVCKHEFRALVIKTYLFQTLHDELNIELQFQVIFLNRSKYTWCNSL